MKGIRISHGHVYIGVDIHLVLTQYIYFWSKMQPFFPLNGIYYDEIKNSSDKR